MVDGPAIFVRTHGAVDAPPVVVLHGGPGAPGSVAALARDLAEAFFVLEPWQRRRDDVPLSVERHVLDLASVTPQRVPVVGWSWGAMLALSYASRYPDRVTGIALIGCGTYSRSTRKKYRRAMRQALGDAARAELDRIQRALEAAKTAEQREALLEASVRVMTHAQSFDPIEEATSPVEADLVGAQETWRDVVGLQEAGIEPQRFAAIRCPVVMLHGEQDPHPGRATYDTLKPHIPQLEYVGFDRCGHEPWNERQARGPFLEALRTLLRPWGARASDAEGTPGS